MKPLQLTLKKKWYDMILSGEKKEEYREIKPYWGTRLLYKISFPKVGFMWPWPDVIDGDYSFKNWKEATGGAPAFSDFKQVQFTNGYRSDSRTMLREIESISIGEGRTEWGAEAGKKYFVIKLKTLNTK